MKGSRHLYLQVIYFIHLIFGSILIYIGIKYYRKQFIEPIVYSLLMLMGFAAIGYHGYWLYNSLSRQHGD